MRTAWLVTIAAGSLIGGATFQQKGRLNPNIDLLAAKKTLFGRYAPANHRGGRGGGRGAAQAGATAPTTPPADAPRPKSQAELASDAYAYKGGDYIFDGSMEGAARFDTAYSLFQGFSKGMTDAGSVATSRISHPIFAKTPKFSADPKLGAERIAKQLNAGVMGVVMVEVESADWLTQPQIVARVSEHFAVPH